MNNKLQSIITRINLALIAYSAVHAETANHNSGYFTKPYMQELNKATLRFYYFLKQNTTLITKDLLLQVWTMYTNHGITPDKYITTKFTELKHLTSK